MEKISFGNIADIARNIFVCINVACGAKLAHESFDGKKSGEENDDRAGD